MKSYPNIEKSAFKRFEYVGYAQGFVWRVRKDGCGGWEAHPSVRHGYPPEITSQRIKAPTLGDISAHLSAWKKPA